MSNTFQEVVLNENEPAFGAAPVRRRHWSRWPKWVLAFLLCLWLADAGFSLFIRHSNLRNRFTARLATAFGRPVEVRDYDFTFLTGPTLTAQSLTVAEDPRFGNEYFLRAESMSVHLRWRSLLRGHLDLGTLSLTRPSLNVVRDANGDWNLADWLPRSSGPASLVGPREPSAPPLFRRIEVDDGRINFKNGDDKLPFAFVDVTGAVNTVTDSKNSGLWQIDLEATPWRAAEILQQAGTIHVAGQVGGTSSRLLPAALDLSWADASVSDVLRLAQSYDHGIRGTMNLAFAARTEGQSWTLQGRAELQQLHRWDLALRPDNPSVTLIAKMKLYPLASGLEVTQATLQGPGSNAQVSGSIVWSPAPARRAQASAPVSAIQVASSGINLVDFLSWVRAFDAGVADDIVLRGFASADGELSGWPLRLTTARVTSTGAELSGQRLRVPLRVGPVEFHYDGDRISVLPVSLTLGSANDPSAGLFRVDASVARRSKGTPVWRVVGDTGQVRDLVVSASELGWNLSRGWDIAGPFRCDFSWPGARFPWQGQPVGFAEFGGGLNAKTDSTFVGASLHAPFLNQPIEQIRARADWKPNLHHITLAAAQAFGAHWSGSFDRGDSDGWQFALSADRLASSNLDQWLNPRWRESLIDRVLPFLNSRASASAVPENLRATGHLSLDQFVLEPVVLRHLRGDLNVGGRHIEFSDAQAQLNGGDVSGSLDADLQPVPTFRVKADFSGVDISSLTEESAGLSGLFDGSASGNISLEAHGASRADLLASLDCTGGAEVRDAEMRNINLPDSVSSAARKPGNSSFREASAAFTCSNGIILFQDLLLVSPEMRIDGAGTLDSSRNVDFRLNVLSGNSPATGSEQADAPIETYQLSGPLSAPQIEKTVATPHRIR